MVGRVAALSDTAATDLVLGFGVGGSLALVVGLTWLASRRSRQEARDRERARHPAAVGARGEVPGQTRVARSMDGDGYPPQPYSEAEPHSHRPYSRPYANPRRHEGSGAEKPVNGSSNGWHGGEAPGTSIKYRPHSDDEN